MATDHDAYRILQVDPAAEACVIRAAYRALAQRYHSDGVTPDQTRMLELDRAFEQLRDPAQRQQYDQRRLQAIPIGAPSPPLRPAGYPAERSSATDAVLDFGRYAGWRLADLARHDADYLRWLARHSSGIRYRSTIKQLLPREDFDRPANAVAY